MSCALAEDNRREPPAIPLSSRLGLERAEDRDSVVVGQGVRLSEKHWPNAEFDCSEGVRIMPVGQWAVSVLVEELDVCIVCSAKATDYVALGEWF